ncbi:mannose-6-phosphate isomerase [Cryptococcus depauperatus]|nr:mannose-6-phosphate isomerase [Cryptococcus depauperatus CBS 7855]
MADSVFKVIPGVQSYAWGKKGTLSLAAQFGSICIPGFEIDDNKTYAELWMGTHPTLPTKLPDETLLPDHLKSHPELIGSGVASRFEDCKDGSLPFLFKVLSIGTALSIQAHPDKKLARKLFDERPTVYKDPNHKPEMAIALSPFLAFLNFLPLPILLLHFLTVPELGPLVPFSLTESLASSLDLPTTRPPNVSLYQSVTSSPTTKQKEILKETFNALISADKELVDVAISKLVRRYEKRQDIKENEKGLVELTLMLNRQYPNDVGVLCVFMLNVIELKRGEAVFLGANEPHAYIRGDIIECMATSDNVVRAGLTPKYRDVSTLVSMLTYEAGPGNKQLLQPTLFQPDDESTKLYNPPIEEFSVLRIELAKGTKATHRKVEGPSLAVVTEGKGAVSVSGTQKKIELQRGEVIFLGAGSAVEWEAFENIEIFRAFVEAGK